MNLTYPNPSVTNNGMVSVTVSGVFSGRVCSNNWTDADAYVTCQMMGYRGGYAYEFRTTTTKPYLMGAVNCSGDEASLEMCPHSLPGHTTGCTRTDYDASVLCYSKNGMFF